jgi:hypothetical protein
MRTAIMGVVALTCGFGTVIARADEVCSAEELRAANAAAARAKSAEAAGDLRQALQHLQSSDVRLCSDAGDQEFKRVARLLGAQSEKSGRLKEAYDYFEVGSHHEDAKRAGLAHFHANPRDRQWAGDLLGFMSRNNFADGVAEIQRHARAQAVALLAQEDKSFAIREPHTELLTDATDWLWVAGDSDAADVKRRALQRADQFAALDYHYALEQALRYYERAGNRDKQTTVRAKAKQLAAGLASGDNWGQAVELYLLADDERSAEDLRSRRSASAAATEAARKEVFDKDTDDLEKELGL